MSPFKTIVLTTDFSEISKQAFAPALCLAEQFGSKLLLAYVLEDRIPPFTSEMAGIGISEIMENHRKRAIQELQNLAANGLWDGIEVEPMILNGIPHREIVALAEDRGADLIVMATHGRGFMAHAILGSTTERVIRRAPCPVLAVRASHAEMQPLRSAMGGR